MLAKGLNCALTPDKVPHDEYILAMELAGSEIIANANQQIKGWVGGRSCWSKPKRKWIISGHI